MRDRTSAHVLLTVTFAALTAVAVSARVFERAQRTAAERLGWEAAYSADLILNGGKASLELWKSSEDVLSTVRAMRAGRGAPLMFTGDQMAWGVARVDGMISSYLVFSPAGPRSCMVTVVTQTDEEYRKSSDPPTESLLKDVPTFPGSRPISFLADHAAGTALESSEVRADSVSVKAYMRDSFANEGWTRMSRSEGLDMYKRGNVLCVMKVNSSSPGGAGRVTLLRKALR